MINYWIGVVVTLIAVLVASITVRYINKKEAARLKGDYVEKKIKNIRPLYLFGVAFIVTCLVIFMILDAVGMINKNSKVVKTNDSGIGSAAYFIDNELPNGHIFIVYSNPNATTEYPTGCTFYNSYALSGYREINGIKYPTNDYSLTENGIVVNNPNSGDLYVVILKIN